MVDKAFFFQGDTLLLPAECIQNKKEIKLPEAALFSLEAAKNFDKPDVFMVPALDPFAVKINAVSIMPCEALPAGWEAIPVRQVIAALSACAENALLGSIIRACHIAGWRQDSSFCGRCGAKNHEGSDASHLCCSKCGRIEFPRICPAIIVIITDDKNRVLLAHNKRFKQGVYSHISGFNEAGETLEETVVREIKEEVGITVKNIAYVKSQPWPFPNSLMVGFKAQYSSGKIHPDGDEIINAGWFTKDNLPALPSEGSLSRFLINEWLK